MISPFALNELQRMARRDALVYAEYQRIASEREFTETDLVQIIRVLANANEQLSNQLEEYVSRTPPTYVIKNPWKDKP